jgi:hypothetical protein
MGFETITKIESRALALLFAYSFHTGTVNFGNLSLSATFLVYSNTLENTIFNYSISQVVQNLKVD